MAQSVPIAKEYAEQAFPETEWAIFKIEYDEFPEELYADLSWGIGGVYHTRMSIPPEHLQLVERFSTIGGRHMAKFNPLDPLGLFSERSEKVTPAEVASSPPGTQFRTSVFGGIRRLEPPKLPAPPDPLGLFKCGSDNPGKFNALDPLGILTPGVPDPYRKGGTIGNPIPIEFNGHLVDIKNQARETLVGKGYPSQQVDMALKWAEEWLLGMARRIAPGNTALQKSIVQSGYAEIASRAESWLRGIEAAFAVGGPVR